MTLSLTLARAGMNRGSYPKLELEFEIVKEAIIGNDFIPTLFIKNTPKVQYYLKFAIKNIGNVYANYVNFFIEINKFFLDETDVSFLKVTRREKDEKVYVEYYGENTIRDVVDTELSSRKC